MLKRLSWPIAVIVLIVALFLAYKSFVTSFFPRLGQGPGKPPAMPAMAIRQMEASARRHAQARAAHAQQANKPDAGKTSHHAAANSKMSAETNPEAK